MSHIKSFSLVELLIVISIIGILAGAVLVPLGDSLDIAKRAVLKSDIQAVERLVKVREIQGKTSLEIANEVAALEASVAAKVIGSWEYLSEEDGVAWEKRKPCMKGNVLYEYFSPILDTDPNINELSFFATNNGNGATRASANLLYRGAINAAGNPRIFCFNDASRTAEQGYGFMIALRIVDDNDYIWWCGTTYNTGTFNAGYMTSQERTGYYTTNPILGRLLYLCNSTDSGAVGTPLLKGKSDAY